MHYLPFTLSQDSEPEKIISFNRSRSIRRF
jgi:hypothetical protein